MEFEAILTFKDEEVYHAVQDILDVLNHVKKQRDELNNRLLLCEEEIRRRDINEKKDIKQDELIKLKVTNCQKRTLSRS